MKKFVVKVRKFHRYIMVILALQMLLWFVSGLYMVSMDIDFIHGDHLVKSGDTPSVLNSAKLNFSDIIAIYPSAKNLRLSLLAGQAVYQFELAGVNTLVSAQTGHSLLPFSADNIANIARYYFSGQADISLVTYFGKNGPSELAKRHLPAWRVEFNDMSHSTLYISASSGQVVTKRHDYWRLFDVVWMLHIMDYQTRSDVSNWLLRFFSILAILATISGAILVSSRFHLFKRLKKSSSLVRNLDVKGTN